ncbi:MAG: DUF692 domain-containing protein [Hyphomicrobiales bacterium]
MTAPARFGSSPIPASAGVGLKAEHYRDILEARPAIGWFEVHAENYMGAGGPPHHYLTRIRELYPVSVHGVGLSIGGAGPLDSDHLARLKQVCGRYEPALVSEHLAWSTHDGAYLNDLLPVPYTQETLARVCEHIDLMQETLGRRMLLENPSTYLAFEASEMDELAFLSEIAERTGCGLLLDVNNVQVSAVNNGFDPRDYLDRFPLHLAGEIHLGGHDEDEGEAGEPLLIDSHGAPVADPVWALYARVVARAGAVPTLIEWDNDVPGWEKLFAEARRADGILRSRGRMHAAAE